MYCYSTFTRHLWKQISPVSAKAAKGRDSLSLLSDRSAMATRPLMRSTCRGCWLNLQMDLKTSPSRFQFSCLEHNWGKKVLLHK